LGRHFVTSTDPAAFNWLCRTFEPMPQLVRWLTFIEQFDYNVMHRPRTRHGNTNGLSRKLVEVDDFENKQDCSHVNVKKETFKKSPEKRRIRRIK